MTRADANRVHILSAKAAIITPAAGTHPEYVKIARQGMEYLQAARSSTGSFYVPFRIKPLHVIKQVMCMFMSANGPKFQSVQPELVRFILNQVSGLHPITHGLRSPSFRGSAKLIAAKRPKISNRVMRMSNHVAKTGRGGSYGADCFSFDLRTVQKAQNFNMMLPFTHFVKQ